MAFSLDSLPELIITVVVVAGVLFVGISAMSTMPDSGTNEQGIEAVKLEGTNFVSVGVPNILEREVYNSLGYAIELTGANNSGFESTQPIEYSTDETWTLSTWAAADANATNQSMTAVSLDGRVVVSYNESAGEWSTWYYSDATRSAYEITAAETGNETQLTQVVVERNGSTLTMFVNGTQGGTADLSTTSSVPAPNASNWDGRIDELRTFDDALNASQRSHLFSSPVAPLAASNRTSRVMFDEPSRSRQEVFFSPASVETSNVGYGDGHDGDKMNGSSVLNEISGDADYVWDWDSLSIRAVDGGRLETAPVAYVDYKLKTLQGVIASGFREFIGLMGTLFIVIPLAFAIFLLRKLG